jgi:hypothetical protein
MFMDGENGTYIQQQKLLADGQDTGVLIVVNGNSNKRQYERKFITKSGEFQQCRQALESAGHTVSRTK